MNTQEEKREEERLNLIHSDRYKRNKREPSSEEESGEYRVIE
jgi:hypothetical protein